VAAGAALRVVPPELVERVQPVSLAFEQRLPVAESLHTLLPGGIQRGSTVAVSGTGATTVALTVLAAPSQADAWAAVVGDGSIGLCAAEEHGVVLHRLVVVDAGPSGGATWATAVAAVVDAFDLVLVELGTGPVSDRDARRLVARAKERGSVLVLVGAGWPGTADVELQVTGSAWEGLGQGDGALRHRRLAVQTGGRRGASRARVGELLVG
jgi:hypothetical protein